MQQSGPPAFPKELRREFRAVRELGRGGSAVVYLARDLELDRDVAIKLIRALHGNEDETLGRSAHEARTAAKLDHPNIVKVHAVRRLRDGTLALVMQHVPGRTLKQAILTDGPFPVDRVKHLLRDIGDALAHAHERGIVHRDVKPENIFLDEGTGRAMLADFGIARVGDGATGLTIDGLTLGTPAYMAPEQIDGSSADARSDQYGLASVAWEMLAGEAPWEGENLYSVIYKQKHESLTPIGSLRRDVPRSMARAIERALAKDATDRFADTRAMLAALEGAAGVGAVDRLRDAIVDLLPKRVPPPAAQADRPLDLAAAEPGAATVRFRRGPAAPDTADAASPQGAEDAQGAQEAVLAATPATPVGRPLPAGPGTEGGPVIRFPFANRGVVYGALAVGLVLLTGFGATLAALTRASTNGGDVGAEVLAAADVARGDGGWGASSDPSASGLPIDVAPIEELDSDTVAAAGEEEVEVDAIADGAAADAAGTGDEARTETGSEVETPAPTRSAFSTAPSIAAGGLHTCAVTGAGELVCWGANGGAGRSLVPRRVGGETRFREVSAGLSHSCAVAEDGRVHCWGGNDSGQLGTGGGTAGAEPRTVSGSRRFRTVATGSAHTCGLTASGEAFCWGRNDHGQVGDGSTTPRPAPRRVAGSFTSLASGWNHTCALGRQGQAYCWGSNADGQLGSASGPSSTSPSVVAGGRAFRSVTAGGSHTCGLTSGGEAFCWGANQHGQLGTGSAGGGAQPVAVQGGPFALITAGGSHTCALARDGAAFCWGRNVYGQLGDGSRTDRAAPVAVAGGARFSTIHASASHTCGVTRGGQQLCWGYNLEGQLGDGSRSHRAVPTPVPASTR
jgi:alpha-tubulin suppressor-like RCC1 family protein